MKFHATKIPGIFSVSVERYGDARGFFSETYSQRDYLNAGINKVFVQDNHSISERRGTVRGLHYQLVPYAQAKLVRCGRGSLFDVVVDIRLGSPAYGQWYGEVLSFDNGRQLYIPEGFAHGFITLEDNTEIVYKCSNFYNPNYEGSIRFDDPDIGIEWPKMNSDFILSKKDAVAPYLRDLTPQFEFEEFK